MAVTVPASATQTAVIGTEHTLCTATCEGVFALKLDVDAMAAGDVLELRTYELGITGGTSQVSGYTMLAGADGGLPGGAKVIVSEPIVNGLAEADAVKYTLKQTFGTGRAFPYHMTRESVGACTSIFSIHSIDNAVNAALGACTTIFSVKSVENAVNALVGTLSAGAIDTGDIAAAALNEIADAVLDRVMSAGVDSGADNTAARTVRQALRRLRNKEAIAAGTGTVYKEDDATAAWTYGATTAAGNPLSAVDPT